ncbi:hypothetical protein Bca101_048280 [Brassica carinata]
MHEIVDEKTDVFAFGVLLLEIITGRRAVDTASRQSIVMWMDRASIIGDTIDCLKSFYKGSVIFTTNLSQLQLHLDLCLQLHQASIR